MTVIDVRQLEQPENREAFEVLINLDLLRQCGTPDGDLLAHAEMERVREVLLRRGATERTTARIVAALARYAFLIQNGCQPAHRALWRMYAVDEVPAEVLAQLTWDQVRPYQREISVAEATGARYFDLSLQTSRLLRLLRGSPGSRVAGDGPRGLVFHHRDGAPWDPDELRRLLARICGSTNPEAVDDR